MEGASDNSGAGGPATGSSAPRGQGSRGRGRGRGGNQRGRGSGNQNRRGGNQQTNSNRNQQRAQDGTEDTTPTNLAAQEVAAATRPQAPPAEEILDDAEICFICANVVVHHSIAPCNHTTCHICGLRMRALYKDKNCAHCRVRRTSPVCPCVWNLLTGISVDIRSVRHFRF